MIINFLVRIRDGGIAEIEIGAFERDDLCKIAEIKLDFPVEAGNRVIKIGGISRTVGVELSEYIREEKSSTGRALPRRRQAKAAASRS